MLSIAGSDDENASWWVAELTTTSLHARDQVHHREDDDPDHVDEVPVQTDQLDGLGFVVPQLALRRQDEQREQHEDADGDVGTVEPGEHEETAAEEVLVQRQAGPVEDGELVDL